jgi:putative oxidoreductase
MNTALFSSLGKYRDLGLLILRLGIGASFILHGYPKITGGPEEWAGLGQATGYLGIHFAPTFFGFMAAFAEFGGGIMLVLGLFTRLGAALMLITMVVAMCFHLGRGDGISGASHAIEAAAVFAGLLFVGPGRFSVDRK